MALVHGQGDHSGRFGRLVGPLVEHGYGVCAYDQRGFGQSPGRKGHINRWREYGEDLGAFLQLVAVQQPGAPVFLLGYSLGSVVVLDYILDRPEGLNGAISVSLPIEPAGPVTPGRVFLANLFSRVWPTFTLNIDGDYNGVSRDLEVQEALRNDPLHHGLVTARWGTELLATREFVAARAADLRLPVLFLTAVTIRLAGPVECSIFTSRSPIRTKL